MLVRSAAVLRIVGYYHAYLRIVTLGKDNAMAADYKPIVVEMSALADDELWTFRSGWEPAIPLLIENSRQFIEHGVY